MGKGKMYIPISIDGSITFRTTNVIEEVEARVNEYNTVQSIEEYFIVNSKVINIICCCMEYQLNEFVRAMSVLLLARAGRLSNRAPWLLRTFIAFESGVPEIYRELVSRAVNTYGLEKERISLNPLSSESAGENAADIMGMITDELGELSEDDYEELLEDFAPLLVQWKNFDVSEYEDEEVYELVYEMIRRCYEHKAYRTATRLSGLLYIADEPEKKPNLGKTNLLMGKIMYELGYMDVAKRCFMFADGDTHGKCWEGVPEKYRALLGQETKIELTEEIRERQKFIDDGIASGKITAYTREELDEHIHGKQRVKLPRSQRAGQ